MKPKDRIAKINRTMKSISHPKGFMLLIDGGTSFAHSNDDASLRRYVSIKGITNAIGIRDCTHERILAL